MNKIILTGRLTKDPEIRYTQKGKVVAQFTLAVDRPFTNQDGQREADFINNVAWGKTAEVIGNHVHKGHKILSEGRLQIRQYTDKNGAKRYATEVIVNNIEFLERKQQAGGTTAAEPPADGNFESFAEGQQSGFKFDEEIPF